MYTCCITARRDTKLQSRKVATIIKFAEYYLLRVFQKNTPAGMDLKASDIPQGRSATN